MTDISTNNGSASLSLLAAAPPMAPMPVTLWPNAPKSADELRPKRNVAPMLSSSWRNLSVMFSMSVPTSSELFWAKKFMMCDNVMFSLNSLNASNSVQLCDPPSGFSVTLNRSKNWLIRLYNILRHDHANHLRCTEDVRKSLSMFKILSKFAVTRHPNWRNRKNLKKKQREKRID